MSANISRPKLREKLDALFVALSNVTQELATFVAVTVTGALSAASASITGAFTVFGATTLNAGVFTPVTTVAAATYDLLVTDHLVHVDYTTTAAVTSLTLPTAQLADGRRIVIKDVDGNATANNITIDTQGAETIDGAATVVIAVNYGFVELYSDGTHWYVLGSRLA